MSVQFFESSLLISVSLEKIKEAEHFANQVINTVNYSDSNQRNTNKVRTDHFISKIGEEAVYAAFRRYTDNIKPPDYKIYLARAKSWDADLTVNEVDLAVKTQARSAAQKYGLSWTFQAGIYRRDIILDNPEAWVCFTECNDLDSSYKCVVYPPLQIKRIKFSDPVIQRLKGEKLVAYAKENGFT